MSWHRAEIEESSPRQRFGWGPSGERRIRERRKGGEEGERGLGRGTYLEHTRSHDVESVQRKEMGCLSMFREAGYVEWGSKRAPVDVKKVS